MEQTGGDAGEQSHLSGMGNALQAHKDQSHGSSGSLDNTISLNLLLVGGISALFLLGPTWKIL